MRELVRKGHLEQAITLAIRLTENTTLYDLAIVVSAEYRKYKKDKIMGIISADEDSLKHARLVAKLLDLMHEYEDLQITLIKDDFTVLISELGAQASNSDTKEVAVTASQIVSEQPDSDKDQTAKRFPWYLKVRDFLLDTADDDSKQNKAIKGVKKGAGLIQDIARKYNSIAQWVGLMQIPDSFL